MNTINLDDLPHLIQSSTQSLLDVLHISYHMHPLENIRKRSATIAPIKQDIEHMVEQLYIWDVPLSLEQKQEVLNTVLQNFRDNNIFQKPSFGLCESSADLKKVLLDELKEHMVLLANDEALNILSGLEDLNVVAFAPTPSSTSETFFNPYISMFMCLEEAQQEKFDIKDILGEPGEEYLAKKPALDLLLSMNKIKKISHAYEEITEDKNRVAQFRAKQGKQSFSFFKKKLRT